MRLLEIIEGVNGFECSKEELIWVGNKILLDRALLFEGNLTDMNSNESLVVAETDESGTYVIEKKSKTQYQIDRNGHIISRSLLLLGKWNDDYSSRRLFAWDYKKNSEVWKSESYFGKPVVFNGFLFGRLKTKLYRINPETGQPIWQKNLEEYGFYLVNGKQKPIDVQAYIGIYNDVLYFKAGVILILGVDVNNGKEVFKYEYDQEGWALDNKNVTLDVENGVIFSIGRKNYFEINLSTQVAFQSDHFEQTKEFGVETTNLGGWEGDLIYFWEGSFNTKFGVFRRSSRSIIYAQAVKEAESFLIDVKYGQNKLYIHDRNACLHIYETSDVIV